MGNYNTKEDIVVAQSGANASTQDITWSTMVWPGACIILTSVIIYLIIKRCTASAKSWMSRQMEVLYSRAAESSWSRKSIRTKGDQKPSSSARVEIV